MAPEVSVIIPTRDRRPFVSVALRSVLDQRDANVEVIVVDDGSIDATGVEIARLEDPRVRAVRHAAPLGVARARNEGLRNSRGRWVAFLDDDDVWAPHKLRTQLDRASRDEASFVYSAAITFDERTGIRQLIPADSSSELRSAIMERNAVPNPSTVLVATDLVREVGGFDEQLSLLADWDLWIKLAATGVRATVCSEPLVGCRLHSRNMSVTIARREREREYDLFIAKHRAEGRTLTIRGARARELAVVHRRAGHRHRASLHYLRAAVIARSSRDLGRAVALPFGERVMAWGRRDTNQRVQPEWLHRFTEQRDSSMR